MSGSIYKLKKKLLKTNDIVYLSIFFILAITRVLMKILGVSIDDAVNFDLFCCGVGFLFFIRETVMKFVNSWFAILYVLSGSIYAVAGNTKLCCYNLYLFLIYHVIRLIFITVYQREFIPPVIYRSSIEPSYDEDNGKESEREDLTYRRITIALAIATLLLSVKFSHGYG